MAYIETGLLAAILTLIVAFTLSALNDAVTKIVTVVVTLCLATLYMIVRKSPVKENVVS